MLVGDVVVVDIESGPSTRFLPSSPSSFCMLLPHLPTALYSSLHLGTFERRPHMFEPRQQSLTRAGRLRVVLVAGGVEQGLQVVCWPLVVPVCATFGV